MLHRRLWQLRPGDAGPLQYAGDRHLYGLGKSQRPGGPPAEAVSGRRGGPKHQLHPPGLGDHEGRPGGPELPGGNESKRGGRQGRRAPDAGLRLDQSAADPAPGKQPPPAPAAAAGGALGAGAGAARKAGGAAAAEGRRPGKAPPGPDGAGGGPPGPAGAGPGGSAAAQGADPHPGAPGAERRVPRRHAHLQHGQSPAPGGVPQSAARPGIPGHPRSGRLPNGGRPQAGGADPPGRFAAERGGSLPGAPGRAERLSDPPAAPL